MKLVCARITAALIVLLCLAGCTDIVLNSISPQEARRQVIDVSRQVVADLGADVAEAIFSYKSCNDYGKAPFQGYVYMGLWMPGADRSREVSPEPVLDRLRQHGWQTDPDFHSHAVTFKRDGVDVNVWVIPPPKPDQPPVAHISIKVYGECRDTVDHRSEESYYRGEDITEELTSG